MATINQIKEQSVADTPLLFFQCLLPSGDAQFWSTHRVNFNGQNYSARVLRHNLFELQLCADDAMDGVSQLSLTLANADSALSELNAAIGFKGTQLTVYFAFADLVSATVTSESTVLFRGIAGDPDEISESTLTLSFLNKLSLHRVALPDIRIQRTCPWTFPNDPEQRLEAKDGGARGRFSPFYRCGYSADLADGIGNLDAGQQPFTSCDRSRAQCIERGMFDRDSRGNETRRFGGVEFVPSVVTVRTSGDKASHLSPLLNNAAKYNDPVPLIYGTGWLKAPVIFARNDGNLTHLEVVAGAGKVQKVLKVVVNDVEIPESTTRQDFAATGWYTVLTQGERSGNFNSDFLDSNGSPIGDPYGSVSALSVVVPNRISNGGSVPTVELLLQGAQIDSYNLDGSFLQTAYSNNPAWVILDILRRSGWQLSDLNVRSFASAAGYCGELIETTDLNGNQALLPRYSCNLAINKRQSAATVIRGIRVASSLMLRYGATGLLELVPETTLARQQPSLPDGGNSTTPLNGGWPAYEFSDGSAPFSGIARSDNGASSVRLSSRNIAEVSNRLSVEFQDEGNEYQQDSLSLVDNSDFNLIGYEISSQSTALGIPNYNQATRVLLRQLDKLTKGNLFVEFQTSFRALKVRPGDIITVTYLKEGFDRLPFRVVKLSPSINFQTVALLAQIHNDDWYSDNAAVLAATGRQPKTQLQIPRPLIGLEPKTSSTGEFQGFEFRLSEDLQALQDGSTIDTVTVDFAPPVKPDPKSTSLPLLSLAADIAVTGGGLSGGKTYYYAISATNVAGAEGALSFTVAASVPSGDNTNTVTIKGLSFPRGTASFNVYRGETPQLMYRIDAGLALADSYIDDGRIPQAVGIPDPNFDHANFYYRYEFAGPFETTTASCNTISCKDMGASAGAYFGMLVRVIDGLGTGQERLISANDRTTLSLTSSWSVVPDNTSKFVICDASWKFAAVSAVSPARFDVGYRAGSVIQISGRSANIFDQECSADLCPLTRLALGNQNKGVGVALAPSFVLDVPGGGLVSLSNVGFSSNNNIASISSGTLRLYHWNEVFTPSPYALVTTLDENSAVLQLNQISLDAASGVIQAGEELMMVLSVNQAAKSYTAIRGVLGSTAASHSPGEPVLHLNTTITVVPFARDFFKNRASINYLHSFALPDIRISAAELFVSNPFGDSEAQVQCFSSLPDRGLRTLSGGQFTIQTSGSTVTRSNAAPPLVIEADHAVRDVRASLGQACSGYDVSIQIYQDAEPYTDLVISSGQLSSAIVSGIDLPPLRKLSVLNMDISLNPVANHVSILNPGRDLTVTFRL